MEHISERDVSFVFLGIEFDFDGADAENWGGANAKKGSVGSRGVGFEKKSVDTDVGLRACIT